MRCQAFHGALDKAHVRLAPGGEWGWDGDQLSICFTGAGHIGGGVETSAGVCCLDCRCRGRCQIALTREQALWLGGVNIEAEHADASGREGQR